MEKTKAQKVIFSLLMAFVMVFGMESYNHIIVANRFSLSVFAISFFELAWLMAVVIALQTFAGAPLARKIAFRFVKPESNRKFIILAMQISTVLIMCPLMSFVAALAFKNGLHDNTVEIWLKTIAWNFPMALTWQILVAGPAVRFVVGKVKV